MWANFGFYTTLSLLNEFKPKLYLIIKEIIIINQILDILGFDPSQEHDTDKNDVMWTEGLKKADTNFLLIGFFSFGFLSFKNVHSPFFYTSMGFPKPRSGTWVVST